MFIRWALDTLNSKGQSTGISRAEALRYFVSRSIEEPPTEALFADCFGMTFNEADAALKAYLPKALRQTITLYPETGLTPPAYTIRDASSLEIGRIKGGLARLEIGYVRARYPALTEQYIEQARRVLRQAYDHGSRDPELLVEMGLAECDALNEQAAMPFLQEATQAGVVRPRAYYELARIEYARLQSEGQTPQNAPESYEAVFNLLATARQQSPSLAAIYELYTRIWMTAEMPPNSERAAILKEGVQFHPRNHRLILGAALYYTMFWQNDVAEQLITQGLKETVDPRERAKFIKLRTMIDQASRRAPQ